METWLVLMYYMYTLGDSGDFSTSRYQGIVKATVSGVFEDLMFKISEGSDQNWSCPVIIVRVGDDSRYHSYF